MLIPILLKTAQIFGIIATISMLVAVIIKLLVMSTGRISKAKPLPKPATPSAAPPAIAEGIPAEVVAAITAALAVVTGPHRVLRIAESQRNWSNQGRITQHYRLPRR